MWIHTPQTHGSVKHNVKLKIVQIPDQVSQL